MNNIEKYKNVRIITHNCSEKLGALLFMSSLTGAPVDAEVLTNVRNGTFEFPNVGLNGASVTGWLATPNNPNIISVPFVDMYRVDKYLPKPYVEVQLNDEMIAHVYPDKIVVGCQMFRTTIIPALSTAFNKIQNQK